MWNSGYWNIFRVSLSQISTPTWCLASYFPVERHKKERSNGGKNWPHLYPGCKDLIHLCSNDTRRNERSKTYEIKEESTMIFESRCNSLIFMRSRVGRDELLVALRLWPRWGSNPDWWTGEKSENLNCNCTRAALKNSRLVARVGPKARIHHPSENDTIWGSMSREAPHIQTGGRYSIICMYSCARLYGVCQGWASRLLQVVIEEFFGTKA